MYLKICYCQYCIDMSDPCLPTLTLEISIDSSPGTEYIVAEVTTLTHEWRDSLCAAIWCFVWCLTRRLILPTRWRILQKKKTWWWALYSKVNLFLSFLFFYPQRLSGLGYCFSASLPPMLATPALVAIDLIKENPSILADLSKKCKFVHRELSK